MQKSSALSESDFEDIGDNVSTTSSCVGEARPVFGLDNEVDAKLEFEYNESNGPRWAGNGDADFYSVYDSCSDWDDYDNCDGYDNYDDYSDGLDVYGDFFVKPITKPTSTKKKPART
ncbi:hypothetical protein BG005_002038 [Podila minutissima]|nr:hypothetical protein BG005_002038 [Podila minutissima]